MKKLTDEQFVQEWLAAKCSPTAMAKNTGLATRSIYKRRDSIEKKLGTSLESIPVTKGTPRRPPLGFERRRQFRVKNGTVIFFSDPHWLPDHDTTAQNALEMLIEELRPAGVICGGDAADGDTISRWDPTRGHHKRFTVREEMECVKEHFDAVEKVAGNAWLAWILGNHDVRLSRFIAVKAPELKEMPFTRLEDWAPHWPLSWTVEINAGTPGMTVLRHRNQAGMLHLQAQKAGCHYAHGHLHRLNIHRMPTFQGVRYSIDGGSLADPTSDGFDYAEGNIEHAQGFVVLTYRNYILMPPEICELVDGKAWFRGKLVGE